MMLRISLACVLGLALASAFGQVARAQFVTNGGFETGDFTDWTVGGGGDAGIVTAPTHSGTYAAFGSNSFPCDSTTSPACDPPMPAEPTTLSQTITGLVLGDQYTFDIFVQPDEFTATDGTATFDATLGGEDLIGGPISALFMAPPGAWSEFPDTFIADANTAGSSTLVLTANSNSGDFFIDDVSIDAVGVPEPMSALVLATAVGAFTLVRRRRA
jgi:hypothetical protein